MIIENNTPETVREQLFYMDGYIRSLEEDENGYVKIHVDWLIGTLGAALQLAHDEKLPKITYRDVELPKGTIVSSTDYPPANSGCSDRPPFEFETGSVFNSL